MLSYYMIRYNFELVVIILNLKVILNEEHETYISQLQIMQKPKIVHYFSEKSRRYLVSGAIFCFANLKVKDTKYRTLSI